jgi:hypothetical protein
MKLAVMFRACTDRVVLLASVGVVLAACGGGASGSGPPPASPAASSSAEAAAPEASPAPAATPDAKAEPETAKAPETATDAAPTAADTAPHGTNITYRMTASGLVIELDGVQLEPKAEPIQLGGGWGVKVVVRARAVDEKEHHLQNPAKGPLMIAEEIDRGGKKELVPDSRSGDGELTIGSGTTPIERELRKPIVAGQSLTLHVGLWGLGKSADDRKPIKKLFVVKMVAGQHKPQPVVSAPE